MQARTSYDTSLKHLYRLGLESAIPPKLRKQIPRSTIHRWRHEKDEKYFGFKLNNIKPYSALDGMTPAEVHELLPHYADNMSVQREMKEARLSRCEANKCNSCEDCPFIKDKVPLII